MISIKDFKWSILKTRRGMCRTIIVELLNHYRLASIKFIDPKVIITFIDNSSSYHWLCKNYKSATFFAEGGEIGGY